MVFISAKNPLCGVGETRVSVATRGNKTAWNPPVYLTKGGMVGRSGLVASGHDFGEKENWGRFQGIFDTTKFCALRILVIYGR